MPRIKLVPCALAERYKRAGFTREQYIEIRQAEMRRLAATNLWHSDDLKAALTDVERVAASAWGGVLRTHASRKGDRTPLTGGR